MSKLRLITIAAALSFAGAAAQANGPAGYDPLAFVPKDETPRAMVKFNQLRAQQREIDFATAASGEDSGSFWLAQHGWKTDGTRVLARVAPVKAK